MPQCKRLRSKRGRNETDADSAGIAADSVFHERSYVGFQKHYRVTQTAPYEYDRAHFLPCGLLRRRYMEHLLAPQAVVAASPKVTSLRFAPHHFDAARRAGRGSELALGANSQQSLLRFGR